MYNHIVKVLEVKPFNTKQVIIRGLTAEGKELYLYTTANGEWKQTNKEVFQCKD